MFMRLNVLDLFTTPLRLCRLSSPCSGGVERLLWASWGISEAKHIFYSENFLPWSFSRRDQVSNSPFLQSDAGMIISPQYQNKKVPQPRLDAILLVIQPKLCKICGCECSNQKRRGRRQVRGEREAQRQCLAWRTVVIHLHKENLKLESPTPALHPLLVGAINNLTIMGFSFIESLPIPGRLWGCAASCWNQKYQILRKRLVFRDFQTQTI